MDHPFGNDVQLAGFVLNHSPSLWVIHSYFLKGRNPQVRQAQPGGYYIYGEITHLRAAIFLQNTNIKISLDWMGCSCWQLSVAPTQMGDMVRRQIKETRDRGVGDMVGYYPEGNGWDDRRLILRFCPWRSPIMGPPTHTQLVRHIWDGSGCNKMTSYFQPRYFVEIWHTKLSKLCFENVHEQWDPNKRGFQQDSGQTYLVFCLWPVGALERRPSWPVGHLPHPQLAS